MAANAASSRDGRAGWIDPDNARGGEDDFEAVTQKLAAQFGKAADQMDAVAALGHVGFGAALKIAVGKARKFFEECQAQTDFQTASEAQQAGRESGFRATGARPRSAMAAASRLRPTSMQSTKQNCFDDHAAAGQGERDGDRELE